MKNNYINKNSNIHIQDEKSVEFFIILLITNLLFCFEFEINFHSEEYSQTIIIGFDEYATNGFDSGIDIPAPPLSPEVNSFDVRIINDDSNFDLIKDIRLEILDEYEFLINWQNDSNAEFIVELNDAIPENMNLCIQSIDEPNTVEITETDQFYLILTIEDDLAIDFMKEMENIEISISPNPFNAHTAINLTVPSLCFTTLQLFDIKGNLVETIFTNNLNAGTHAIHWYGENQPSGIYFLNVSTFNEYANSYTHFTQEKIIRLI